MACTHACRLRAELASARAELASIRAELATIPVILVSQPDTGCDAAMACACVHTYCACVCRLRAELAAARAEIEAAKQESPRRNSTQLLEARYKHFKLTVPHYNNMCTRCTRIIARVAVSIQQQT